MGKQVPVPTGVKYLGEISGWMFGVLLLLGSLLYIFSGHLIGILFIVVGIICLPPINKYLEQKWNFQIPFLLKITSIVICVFIIAILGIDPKVADSLSIGNNVHQQAIKTESNVGEKSRSGIGGDSAEAVSVESSYGNLHPKDTGFFFIKRLLNASPEEVAKIIGNPDEKIEETDDCTEEFSPCNNASYHGGGLSVLYYKNKLKFLTYFDHSGLQYNQDIIEHLGFPSALPTSVNQACLSWENYEGIKIINVFSGEQNTVNYISIQVDKNYNKKFGAVDNQTMVRAHVESQEQEKIEAMNSVQHKKLVESQFSSWDGSNIYLEKAIKSEMKDPGSYEHVSTKYFDLGDKIKVVEEYRGANAFGAKVKSTVIALINLEGNILEMETAK